MLKILFSNSAFMKDVGLLVLRVGIGMIFMRHGFGKLFAGQEMWTSIGSAISNFGIHRGYALFGFAAGLTEAFGGLCLLLGMCTRIAAFCMSGVMIVAATMHYMKKDPWTVLSHPLSMLVVFVSLVVMGAGRFGLDRQW